MYLCITVLGRTDFEHPIFSIISSQGCFIEIIDKIGCSKSVRLSTVIYVIYIYIYISRTDFEHNPFKQHFKTYFFCKSVLRLRVYTK